MFSTEHDVNVSSVLRAGGVRPLMSGVCVCVAVCVEGEAPSDQRFIYSPRLREG